MSRSRGFARTLIGPLLAAIALVVAVAAAELVLRWRYTEPAREANAEVDAIQRHLQLHPDLGFTWKPSITESDNVRLTVRDVTFELLTTDAGGFKNPPKAIARLNNGESPAVIGLGDSFIEHAHSILYERFEDAGQFYINRAIHRQTTPQYNAILKRNLQVFRPRVVIYGLFENDFAEAEDYTHWAQSGLDWFTFHSGTWCGPPIETSMPERIAKQHLKGFTGAFKAIGNRLRGDRMTTAGPSISQTTLMFDVTQHAITVARENSFALILVLIPSRATAIDGNTLEAQAYDTVLAQLGNDVPTVVDLRPLFQNHPDPASLYYVDDAHWNPNGMNLAADAILAAVLPLMDAQP